MVFISFSGILYFQVYFIKSKREITKLLTSIKDLVIFILLIIKKFPSKNCR